LLPFNIFAEISIKFFVSIENEKNVKKMTEKREKGNDVEMNDVSMIEYY